MLEKKQAHILIVDDTAENIQVLGSLLREEGYILSVAYHGQEALERLKYIKPDIILLDIMMPILDGFKTCKQIKSNFELKDIPILFVTAKADIDDISEGFKLGAVDYITKPFNKEELLLRVQNHLELSFSKKIIEEQNNERKELLHILCHDLKNPLSAVSSYIKLVQKNPKLLNDLDKKLLPMVDSGMDIIEMVRKMRVLEDNKSRLALEMIDVKESIDFALSILHNRISEKNIKINNLIPKDIKILAEKTSFINTIINNLLSNALKFSNLNSEIIFDYELHDEFVIIIIEDKGIGIPDAILNNIFDLTQPTSRAGTQGEKGTGYGMPLVKKFLGSYGADINIETYCIEKFPDNHGTTIKLTFKKD